MTDVSNRNRVPRGVTGGEFAAERQGRVAGLFLDADPDPATGVESGENLTPEVAPKRAQVEHSGDGTLLTIGRDDLEARAAAKEAGFRWSRNLGSWFLPRAWTEPTRRAKLAQLRRALGDDVDVTDDGRAPSTTAAEREEARREHAADRAERMDSRAERAAAESDARDSRARAIGDMIPMGQPILLGHHSERRHRSDLNKIDTNMRKSFDAHRESQEAAAAADRARSTAAGDDPLLRQRRIDKHEARLRAVDRLLDDHAVYAKIPAGNALAERLSNLYLNESRLAQLTDERAVLVDEIAHEKTQIAASGHKAITAADMTPGDVIVYRGRPHVVKKVNKTTVSVPTGYSWMDKIPINQITKVHKPKPAADTEGGDTTAAVTPESN